MRNSQLFLIPGLTSFLILRMWFGKAVEDFNTSVATQGPQFVAQTSNAFTSTLSLVLISHHSLALWF